MPLARPAMQWLSSFSRYLCLAAMLWSLGPPMALATKCGSHRAFLDSIGDTDAHGGMRIVRVKTVQPKEYSPGFFFEIVEFLDGKPGGRVGAIIIGTGIVRHELNLPPAGWKEPPSLDSEWVLIVRGSRLSPESCGAFLSLANGTVTGYIKAPKDPGAERPASGTGRPAPDTGQVMSLDALKACVRNGKEPHCS